MDSFREDLAQGKVAAATKPIAVGIFLDKVAAITGAEAVRSLDVKVMVNQFGDGSISREQLLAILRGEPPQAILPVPGDGAQPVPPA